MEFLGVLIVFVGFVCTVLLSMGIVLVFPISLYIVAREPYKDGGDWILIIFLTLICGLEFSLLGSGLIKLLGAS
jgi:hypothetical protein